MKRAITISLTAIFLLIVALPLLAQSPLASDVQAEDAAPSASSALAENSVAQGDGVSSGVAPAPSTLTDAQWNRIESFYQRAVDDAWNTFLLAAMVIVIGIPFLIYLSNREERKEISRKLEELKVLKEEVGRIKTGLEETIQKQNYDINVVLSYSTLMSAKVLDALIKEKRDKTEWKYLVWACENGIETSLLTLNGINQFLKDSNEELLDGHRKAFKLSIEQWMKEVIKASKKDWEKKEETLRSYSDVIEKGLNEIRVSEKDEDFLSLVERHHNEIKRIIQEMRSSATGEKNEK